MEFRSLGKSEVRITPIIMGTWQAGKTMWAGIEDAESVRAIWAAFDAGITTFDTAEEYGKGHSERIIAKSLSRVRKKAVYATKVSPHHLTYDQVTEACHRSLKNLNTDYIDLYQIHWPAGSWGSKSVPIEETLSAMNDLKRAGKIRAVGVSNFSRLQLEQAARYGEIDSLQPPYSLFWRHAEADTIPYCVEHGITILAYSALAQGILTGKFSPNHRFEKGDHRSRNRLFHPENARRVEQALRALGPIAQRCRATLGQLALAWVIAQPGTCAIAGARNTAQVLENVKAAQISLSKGDVRELDAIGRRVTDHLDDNPIPWSF
ncbi:MAG: aldo/keto reductase [Deltaproteobacteria bacterium]|nr:MAG: aldo/keto reductase [Deltaproteobacteria bacterium]